MKPEAVLSWSARAWGVASAVLLLAFAFGGKEHLRLTASEAVGFLFFPLGVIAGFAIAWWRELAGGMVTIVSLALFYVWQFSQAGQLPTGPYFLLFAAPGFLHVASALLAARRGRSAATATAVVSRRCADRPNVELGAARAPARDDDSGE
jgi:hypothetical protein